MTVPQLIVADIGGTHIRLAMARDGRVDASSVQRFAVSRFAGPVEAISHYFDQTGEATPDAACLAIAGPVANGCVRMANNPWIIDASGIVSGTGISDCRLINDFEALALSLPSLAPRSLVGVGGGKAVRGSCAVLGPGTGLGVAIVAERDGVRLAIPCEGGHMGFAPVDDLEREIHRHLTAEFGRVSNERLVSGPGLENLHVALAQIEGRGCDRLPTRQIIDTGLEDRNSAEWRTISKFCAIFGSIAGDTALGVGAVGGIYLAGGISQRLAEVFSQTPFRQRFDAKGRLTFFTKAIPVHVITSTTAALDGAAMAYREPGAP